MEDIKRGPDACNKALELENSVDVGSLRAGVTTECSSSLRFLQYKKSLLDGNINAHKEGANTGTESKEKLIFPNLDRVIEGAISIGEARTAYKNGAKRYTDLSLEEAKKKKFDCSSLIYYIFKRGGLDIGVNTRLMKKKLPKSKYFTEIKNVGVEQLRAGDIILGEDHVEMYVGGDEILSAEGTEPGVALFSTTHSTNLTSLVTGKPYIVRKKEVAGRVFRPN